MSTSTLDHADAELRMGVDPIDDVLHNRAECVKQLAPMWALYGPGGTADHSLSAERSRIVGLLRAMAAAKEEKITEAALEAGSRAHPDYLALLAKMTSERATFYELQQRLEAIDFRVMRGQALIRAYTSEAMLR